MAKKKIVQEDISILNTNSTEVGLEQEEQALSKKQILKLVAVVAAVVVFVATLLVVGGIVSENIHQKELLRQPDESMSAFYSEETEAPITADKVETIVTQAYYTNEKGLQVFLNFSNGLKENQRIKKIYITIRDKSEQGKVIAKGNTDKISKKTIIPAEGNLDFELYIPPRFVAIKDNSLEKISYDVTLEYFSVK